jgi:hypothetical protein
MKFPSLVLIGVLILADPMPSTAHHSFAGEYILDQTSTIKGTVLEFNVRNPHSYIILNVKGSTSSVVRWFVEWNGATLLTQTGVTAQTLKPGDSVNIIGRPSRDKNARKLLVKVIRRPADGWTWGDRPEEVVEGTKPAHVSAMRRDAQSRA